MCWAEVLGCDFTCCHSLGALTGLLYAEIPIEVTAEGFKPIRLSWCQAGGKRITVLPLLEQITQDCFTRTKSSICSGSCKWPHNISQVPIKEISDAFDEAGDLS